MQTNAYMLAIDYKTLAKESHGGENTSGAPLGLFTGQPRLTYKDRVWQTTL
jgi:hypothetical protein